MKKYNRNLIVLLRVVYQIFFVFAKVAPHSAKIVIFIEYFVEICIVEGKKGEWLIIGLHLYEKKVDFIFDFSSSWFFCVL